MLQAKLQNLSLFPEYRARIPQNTTLYKVVAENYKAFIINAEQTEKRLPKYVVDEFESFLKCGVLAYGFLRQKCEDCKFERVVAFSCKKRGFCSSCGGRRMAECAAHLVDEVFPKVGVRQWVLSFPMVLRFVLAKRPDFQSACLKIVQRCIASYFQGNARKRGLSKIQTGAVTLIQRFGGSVNLNTHFHMLVLEGGYYASGDGQKFFWSEKIWESFNREFSRSYGAVVRANRRFFTSRRGLLSAMGA